MSLFLPLPCTSLSFDWHSWCRASRSAEPLTERRTTRVNVGNYAAVTTEIDRLRAAEVFNPKSSYVPVISSLSDTDGRGPGPRPPISVNSGAVPRSSSIDWFFGACLGPDPSASSTSPMIPPFPGAVTSNNHLKNNISENDLYEFPYGGRVASTESNAAAAAADAR